MKPMVLLLAVLMASWTDAWADRAPRNGQRLKGVRTYRKAPRPRGMMRGLPKPHSVVTTGRHAYYHKGGFNSRKAKRGYAVVRRPVDVHLRALPAGYVSVHVGSGSCFYLGGAFYRWNPALRVYVSIGAPVGAVVPLLPPGYRTVVLASRPYYVLDSDYYAYDPDQDGYRVASPPERQAGPPAQEGPPLESLPPGYQTIHVKGQEIFVLDGMYYRYDDERKAYIRVAPPPGASLRVLPPGYETIHLNGEKVYVSEGVYYRYDSDRELYIVISPPQPRIPRG